jgi:hypothetical protein
MEDRELRRAMARASLRESWRHAKTSGLDQLKAEEINREIEQVRAESSETRGLGHEHDRVRRRKT